MIDHNIVFITVAIFIMSSLYSTVGHGGASGYLAVLALANIAPEQIRTTALVLNIFVASIATIRFYSTGEFSKKLFLPLIYSSVPAAFIGGLIKVAGFVYNPIIAVFLLYAAIRLFIPLSGKEQSVQPPILGVFISGALIGLTSGIIGIGGGVFLSPLLILLGWATAKQTASISAPFILVNSIAGLGGLVASAHTALTSVEFMAPLLLSVIVGGFVGSSFGAKHLGYQRLRQALSLVLFVAVIKIVITM